MKRIGLLLSSMSALLISACAPIGDANADEPSKAPFGYELAHLDANHTIQQAHIR